MDLLSVFDDILAVVVPVPQEPQKVSVVLSDTEAMEHLLNVGGNGNFLPLKVNQNSQETIIEIRACKKHVIEGHTPCCALESNTAQI